MSQVFPDGFTDDGCLGFIPADTRLQTMRLQTQESTQGAEKMIPLPVGAAHLSPLHSAELLDASIIGLDPLSLSCQFLPDFLGHLQGAGRPVFHVAVCDDDSEYPHQAVLYQMHDPTFRGGSPLPPPEHPRFCPG